MNAVFLVCLLGGLVSTALLAALGALTGAIGHGAGHIGGHGAGHLHVGDGHLHTGHLPAPAQHTLAAHPAGHAVSGNQGAGHTAAQDGSAGHALAQGGANPLAAALGWTLSWFTPLTLAAGVLWFGGGGLLAALALPALAVPVAIVAAVLGAGLVRALMAAFLRAEAVPLSAGAEGAMGELSAPIRADALGEVIYTLEGLHRSAAARSVDGEPLPRGTPVVIVRRERGIAYVSPLDPLEQLAPPRALGPVDTSLDATPVEPR